MLTSALGAVGISPVVPVTLRDGTVLLLDGRGRTESEAVWTGEYDAGLRDFLHLACEISGPNYIDVGANVGLLAIPMARKLVEQRGRVLAIEPVPENWARLYQSIELNGLSNVEIVKCAVGSLPGVVTLTRESGLGASSGNAVVNLLGVARVGVTSAAVPVRTLDELVKSVGGSWNVVKIDCEGYDVHVVLGASRLLHDQRPILFGEFHGDLVPRFGPGFGALRDLLASARYRVFIFEELYVIREVSVNDGVGNCALVPDELVANLQQRLNERLVGVTSPEPSGPTGSRPEGA